jgi:hypothetical protein
MEITEIQNRIHQVILQLRRIQDTVKTPKFGVLYDGATEDRKLIVRQLINKKDEEGIKVWLKQELENCLPLLNVRELRGIAIRYGINPSGMDKSLLLFYIEKAKEAYVKKDRSPIHGGGKDCNDRIDQGNETAVP